VPEIHVLGEQEGTTATNLHDWSTAFGPNFDCSNVPCLNQPVGFEATGTQDNNTLFLTIYINSFDFASVQSKYNSFVTGTNGPASKWVWKICIIHYPVYVSPTAADPTPDTKSIRTDLVPWLEQNGFNIVIQGHNIITSAHIR
jgi:hypothetical protein